MTIQYDNKSFVIDGKRVFLNSAAIHYFRMPKEEWRDVLTKAKLAGMNCIDTYFAWNVHEAEEGSFNFEGDYDCGAFIDLCAELGLWVIARPGPFICAEWDFGGYPWWLSTKENMQYRIDHEEHLRYVFRYFDQLLPIISSRQLTKGGNVILVQVENEYGYLAESERGKNYMRLLRDGMLARGIEVPLITCVGGAEETIECANFWSGAKHHYNQLVTKQPDTPKLVTEFWTGWFEHWGGSAALQKTELLYENRMLETIAAGFDGINHYMFYGGTNFGSYGGRTVGSSDIFMITSYDYDAPLNEYGRTTEKYYSAKKLSQFTGVMSSFLLESQEADVSSIKASGGLAIAGLQMDEQRLLFVENKKEERDSFFITLHDELTLPITLEAGQMIPVLNRINVMDGLSLTMGGYLIGNESYANRQVLIISGGKGQRLSVLLEAVDELEWTASDYPSVRYTWHNERQLLLDLYSFEEPQLITMKVNGRLVELVVLNAESTKQAWRVSHSTADWIIGCKDISITAEGVLEGAQDDSRTTLYIDEQSSSFSYNSPASLSSRNTMTQAEVPQLTSWSSSQVMLSSPCGIVLQRPVGFAEFGQEAGYLLYSHELHCDHAGETTIAISALQDPVRVYVNGKEQGFIRDVGAGSIRLQLPQGRNQLQFLVQHMGRLNFSPYLGEEKGISGAVYKDADVVDFRSGWQLENAMVDLSQVNAVGDTKTLKKTWHMEAGKRVLLVGAISLPLKINGVNVELEGYANWFKFHTADLTSYLQAGSNAFEMEYVASPIDRLQLIVCDEQHRLDPWQVVSLGDLQVSERSASSQQKGGPAWQRCSFTWSQADMPTHARLKLRLTGMSKGFIRLNGRNLGRYWQVGPQEDYKLPLAWLNDGINTLELFDEQGRLPHRVKLLFDNHTSMPWTELKSHVLI
ncbi:beta-galactosidase [Paenibacillus camelliae]|uniref:beta-galactosidase n=1 Tax=Paenibacillus camelliae TaxID=512410 RepID=UPI0020425167|nr:beta-galactosidase [Paenibacillus camelliae]MCM3634764.1 beta-galactosidase [Paenibacillus camelliae]